MGNEKLNATQKMIRMIDLDREVAASKERMHGGIIIMREIKLV